MRHVVAFTHISAGAAAVRLSVQALVVLLVGPADLQHKLQRLYAHPSATSQRMRLRCQTGGTMVGGGTYASPLRLRT